MKYSQIFYISSVLFNLFMPEENIIKFLKPSFKIGVTETQAREKIYSYL